MKPHNILFPDELWQAANERLQAEQSTENMSQLIRRLVAAWQAGKLDKVKF